MKSFMVLFSIFLLVLFLAGCTNAGEVVFDPEFNPVPGINSYASPINVELSSKTFSAKIYYSDDGSEPDESSYLYTAPIVLSEDTTIKAKAYYGMLLPSNVVEYNYVFSSSPGQSSSYRSFSSSIVGGGELVEINLDVIVDDSELHDSYEINEIVPNGWTISDVGSAVLVSDNHLRWTVNRNGGTTMYTYVLKAPYSQGIYDFSGNYFIAGMPSEKEIEGKKQITVS